MNKQNCMGCAANGMTQCDLEFEVKVKWAGEGPEMFSNCEKKYTREEYLKMINDKYEDKFKKDDNEEFI